MFAIAALYRFAHFDNPHAIAADLRARGQSLALRGTLLLAHEGINGTIAGTQPAIDEVVEAIRALPGCAALEVKYATADAPPFGKFKVRVKREIVTLGRPDIDPVADTGIRVPPAEWNALIDDPDTIVIDTRNDYEVAIGSFAGAIDPQTASFTAFPDWVAAHRDDLAAPGKRVAMFCTGGIRCEKASALLRREGIRDVYQLDGGILRYLEEIPESDSRWQGDCFVFDERVAVGHGLTPGRHVMCRECGQPYASEAAACPRCAPNGQSRQGFVQPG